MSDDERTIASHDRRTVLKRGALATGTVAFGAVGTAAAQDDENGDDQADDADGDDEGVEVEFQNQTTDGTTVTVAEVALPDGGYVAFHDTTLLDGQVLESVVGVSDYLEPGEHEAVEVTLFDVEGAEFERSSLEGTQPLIAMPHRETSGNQTYDFVSSGGEEDGPYTRAGNAVVDLGFAVVE